jgi:hypothetical protein
LWSEVKTIHAAIELDYMFEAASTRFRKANTRVSPLTLLPTW